MRSAPDSSFQEIDAVHIKTPIQRKRTSASARNDSSDWLAFSPLSHFDTRRQRQTTAHAVDDDVLLRFVIVLLPRNEHQQEANPFGCYIQKEKTEIVASLSVQFVHFGGHKEKALNQSSLYGLFKKLCV